MRAFKLTLIVFLFSAFSVVKGQKIQNCDLYGEWSMDQGRKTLFLNFINDSVYYYGYENDAADKMDHYSLLIKNGQTILNLYTLTGTYFGSWSRFFIRKMDDVHIILQVPGINYETYEIVSYEWDIKDKKNTFDLYRIERHQLITE